MTPRHLCVSGRAALAVLALSWARDIRAERLFVGILEVDSYQSVIYGASAFSRVADLPLALDLVQTTLAKNLSLPSFAGVSATEPLHIVQTLDPALPVAADNPANVALIPLADDGTATREAFAAAYRTQTPLETGTLFETPSDTNLPPRVAIAVADRHLFTSVSRDALAWAWQNRAKLIGAPPQNLPGTFRVLVNPQRLADLLGSRGEKASAFINADKLIRDFDSLAFSLTLDGQALAFAVRGSPKKESALGALTTAWRQPSARLWNGSPDDAFFMSLTASGSPGLWAPYLGAARSRLFDPLSGLAPRTAFTGEKLTYLAPNRNRQGLCFVQIEPVTNAAPVRDAIGKLHTAEKNGDLLLTPKPPRRIADTPVATYALMLQPPATGSDGKPADPSILFTLLSLFLKQAVLETAVADGHLITVIGSPQSIDGELPALAFREKTLTLQRKISAQDPALNTNLTASASLQIASLLRYVVSIMPDVKPEQIRLLPTGGDGATFGISLTDERTLTASLRFQSNEIAALQRINRDGREVLQELFFQMFAKQMMRQSAPPEKK
ncbi:MAG TPA: hypothetical protein PKM57_10585 [Kiritimatiellia bacterium]|nr:hypothetical protein [Kiritimatiellia bacterium]HPS06594.1 hypothetical protein [Kiritimatiellia bacterium]